MSWGWVNTPNPTPIRKVVTTSIHSLLPKLATSVQPLNPGSTPEAPVVPMSASDSNAGVTPPRVVKVMTRMTTIPANMIPA